MNTHKAIPALTRNRVSAGTTQQIPSSQGARSFAKVEASATSSNGRLRDPTNAVIGESGEALTDGKARFGSFLPACEEPIGVAIVDEDDDTRLFLYRILEQSGEFRCVGSYPSGEEAIREVPRVGPQIVLMDLPQTGISGIEYMRRLKGLLPGLIVVLVSERDDPETMAAALAAGGDGYLTKPIRASECRPPSRFLSATVVRVPGAIVPSLAQKCDLRSSGKSLA